MTALRRPESQPRRAKVAQGILVAVHRGHLQVEQALKELTRSRVDLRPVSVVGTDHHTPENVYGYYFAGRRIKAWGSIGNF